MKSKILVGCLFASASLSAGFIASEEECYEKRMALSTKQNKCAINAMKLVGFSFLFTGITAMYTPPEISPSLFLLSLAGEAGGTVGSAYGAQKVVDYYFDWRHPYPNVATLGSYFPDHSYPCARHHGKEVNIQSLMSCFTQQSIKTLSIKTSDANCEKPSHPYAKTKTLDCIEDVTPLIKYIVLYRLGAITFEKPGNGFHQYDARCMQQDGSEITKLYGHEDGPKFYLTSAEPRVVSTFNQHYDFSAEIQRGNVDGRELRLKYE